MSRTPAWLGHRLAALDAAGDLAGRDLLVVAGLKDPDPGLREVAIAWGARCLEPAALLALVADPDEATGRNAALAALERQGPYAVEVVCATTGAPDADEAMFACQVLGRIGGGEAIAALEGALGRPEVNVVQAAAEALGQLRATRSVPALLPLLGREPWLQLPAIEALGAIGASEAAGPLLALLPDSFVAEPAAEALGRIGAPASIAPLEALLVAPGHDHLRPALLLALGRALERAQAPVPLPALAAALLDGPGAQALNELIAGALETPPEAGSGGDDRAHRRGGSAMARAASAVVLAAGHRPLFAAVIRQAADPDGAVWLLPVARRSPALVAALESLAADPDPLVRRSALAAAGGSAPERLRVALADPLPEVRATAAEQLTLLQDPAALPVLADWLGGSRQPLRVAAVGGLSRYPATVLEPVLVPLLDQSVAIPIREDVLAVLASVPVPALAETVIGLATSPEPPLRRAAYAALGPMPESKAEVALLRGLADREPELQVYALEVLVGRGGERLTATLTALLAVNDSLRYHVIRALGRLRATRAAAALEALFPSAAHHEQLEIVTALARLGGAGVRPFLLECLERGGAELRRVAAQGIAAGATADDLDLLTSLARDQDWVIRNEAAHGLGLLGGAEARRALLDLARDLEPAVQGAARRALSAAS